jgi:hypothetical protein
MMTTKPDMTLLAMSDKTLLEAAQKGSEEAAAILTERFFGKVTPEIRSAWPALRRAKRISVHAARRLLVQEASAQEVSLDSMATQ